MCCCWPACVGQALFILPFSCCALLRSQRMEVHPPEDEGEWMEGEEWGDGGKEPGWIACLLSSHPLPLPHPSSASLSGTWKSLFTFQFLYTCRIHSCNLSEGRNSASGSDGVPASTALPFPHKSQGFPFQRRRPSPCQTSPDIPAPVFGDGLGTPVYRPGVENSDTFFVCFPVTLFPEYRIRGNQPPHMTN